MRYLVIAEYLTTNTMIGRISMLLLLSMLLACASSKSIRTSTSTGKRAELFDETTFVVTEQSTDPTYGLTEGNPVKVGGANEQEGPRNERRYLNALTGPQGQKISYYRLGSCCSFKTENGFLGEGLLDNYRVTWEGSADTVSIYINMYDFGDLKAPVGFGLKNPGN